jgi:hypothetical protein
METISPVVSVIALIVSLFTAWFTIFLFVVVQCEVHIHPLLRFDMTL